MTTTTARIQDRSDTAANWTSANPTLLAGEMGVESDTGRWKLGNGTSSWTALPYQPTPADLAGKANTSALAPVAFSGAKADVGLGNVNNTSDAAKPLSTAAVAALASKADLDSDGKVPASQLPPSTTVSGVASVNTRTGAVTLTKADVGLGSVDNTSDLNKPVSTATQTALNGKATVAQFNSLATVASTGDYRDLINAPSTALVNNHGSVSGTVPIDITTGTYHSLTLTAPATLTFTGWPTAGNLTRLTLEVTSNAYPITWPSGWKWAGRSVPTATTGGTDLYTLVSRDAGSTVHASEARNYGTPLPVATLPWKSGSYQSDTGSLGGNTAGHDAFGAWRGRTDQVVVAFATGSTWATITSAITGIPARYGGSTYMDAGICVTFGLFPDDGTSNPAAAAAGTYDSNYTSIGNALVTAGLTHCYIRPGWEFNGGYPWQGTANATAASNYRTAFQRMVTRIRAAGWVGKVVFCSQVTQQLGTVGPDACYPGDNYVDVISVDWYDSGTAGLTEAQRWAARRDAVYGGRWWADFCQEGASRLDNSAGAGSLAPDTAAKSFAVPEWALRNPTYGGVAGSGGDSPYYIRAMHDFLREVDASGVTVEFEAYFNKDNASDQAHQLFRGVYDFSNAARTYQSLFGAG